MNRKGKSPVCRNDLKEENLLREPAPQCREKSWNSVEESREREAIPLIKGRRRIQKRGKRKGHTIEEQVGRFPRGAVFGRGESGTQGGGGKKRGREAVRSRGRNGSRGEQHTTGGGGERYALDRVNRRHHRLTEGKCFSQKKVSSIGGREFSTPLKNRCREGRGSSILGIP